MKRAHPNDTLKVDFTSIPDSRNLRWPQNIGANGWENAICDWEFWKKWACFGDQIFSWNRQKMKKPKALYFNSFKSWFSKKKFFWPFWPFSCLFWRVLKKHFEKKNEHILTPPKKVWNRQKITKMTALLL